MSAHFFDIEIATQYGTGVATFLNHLSFWLTKNLANRKNLHDGTVWTYNSHEALLEIFPYWSQKNLRTILKKCVDNDLILVGNYNKNKYDRTAWYALTLKGISLFPSLKSSLDRINSDVPEPADRKPESGQPIPDNKTDNKNNTATAAAAAPPKKTPKPKPSSKVDEFHKGMVESYRSIFPDNPQPNIEDISDHLKSAMNKFIGFWPHLHETHVALTNESFHTYLKNIREFFPNWSTQPYQPITRKNGVIEKSENWKMNNLATFLRKQNALRAQEGDFR